MAIRYFHLAITVLACMAAAVTAQSKPGCRSTCGDLQIRYPFGTEQGCYKDEAFLITCNTSSGSLMANISDSNIQVLNISLDVGEIWVGSWVSEDCHGQHPIGINTSMRLANFSISNTKNKSTVIGCDTYAYLMDISETRFATGCMLQCRNVTDVTNSSCSGIGCCQTSFPKAIKNYTISLRSFYNHKYVLNFNPCSYAFVVEDGFYNFSSLDLMDLGNRTNFPVVLNWVIDDKACAEAITNPSSYACKENSECVDSESGLGYLCKCKDGYEGNPYLDQSNGGCQDVNECITMKPCNITRNCQNLPGNYSCSCPKGYQGDGYKNGTGCTLDNSTRKLLVIETARAVSVGFLVLFTLISSLCWIHKLRTIAQLRRKYFEHNGGHLLQERLSEVQRYGERTKIFREVELEKATDNFHESRIIGRGGQGIVYKGILEDSTPVAIKKSIKVEESRNPKQVKDFINEMVVLSQINHRNVVKLLGFCLETEVPLLVYEFVPNGTLFSHIDPTKNECTISWETRLWIAAETAEAISYLHSAASIPIIHRDIKSSNILLDHNNKAKVSDFGASRLVPLDQAQVPTLVQGTLGYLDPEYLHTGQLTEKSDVYSFGVLLLELLTGKKVVEFNGPEQKNLAMEFVFLIKEGRLLEILDRRVMNEKNVDQMKEVALIARNCVRMNGEERPCMKEVASELAGLLAMEKHPWVKGALISEENEYLLGSVSGECGAAESNSVSNDSIQRQMAFEIGNRR